jgi:hypothetical protein
MEAERIKMPGGTTCKNFSQPKTKGVGQHAGILSKTPKNNRIRGATWVRIYTFK